MIDAQLEALAVHTRRHIYTMLLEQPRSVQEIADEMPVSRPAVSQHLKVLVEAGLAKAATVATRRVYSADPEGVAEFRAWADRLWSDAIGSFADFVSTDDKENEMLTEEIGIEPVVKSLRLKLTPDEAFTLFTEEVDTWWPLDTHSVGEDEAEVPPRPVVVRQMDAAPTHEVQHGGEPQQHHQLLAPAHVEGVRRHQQQREPRPPPRQQPVHDHREREEQSVFG